MESDDVATLDLADQLQSRRSYFTDRLSESVGQVVHRISTKYHAGVYTMYDVAEAFDRIHALNVPSIGPMWRDAGLPHQAALRHWLSAQPTEEDGSWVGVPDDLCEQITPPLGQPVVYVLYGDDCEPVYVGSTSRFRHRIKDHRKSKAFAHWKAWPCPTREDAYRREDAMLKGVLPPLNKRAGR